MGDTIRELIETTARYWGLKIEFDPGVRFIRFRIIPGGRPVIISDAEINQQGGNSEKITALVESRLKHAMRYQPQEDD